VIACLLVFMLIWCEDRNCTAEFANRFCTFGASFGYSTLMCLSFFALSCLIQWSSLPQVRPSVCLCLCRPPMCPQALVPCTGHRVWCQMTKITECMPQAHSLHTVCPPAVINLSSVHRVYIDCCWDTSIYTHCIYAYEHCICARCPLRWCMHPAFV